MARRSARLGKAGSTQQSPQPSKLSPAPRLGSVLEQDEFLDAVEQQQSIDNVINTPVTTAVMQQQLKALSSLKTPKTEPKASRAEMHPKILHSTTKPPNSGDKFGFADLPPVPPTIASAQNTPSKHRQTASQPTLASSFKFTFGSDAVLSSEAQQLMDNVREEAARIKAQMQLEKDNQDEKDARAEQMFDGINASGRKIAKPKAKAGRFSDVHMAQFKKMDSIANHASSFRGKPGYTQPTAQSLKRSGSKAGLDEPERPRTAGKGTPSQVPPFGVRPASASPFKSIQQHAREHSENPSPAKRLRRSEVDDVSSHRRDFEQAVRPTTIPQSISSTLFSPTKASIARSSQNSVPSPNKPSMIPGSNSTKSTRTSTHKPRPSSAGISKFTSKLLEAQQEAQNTPPPPLHAKAIRTHDQTPIPSSFRPTSVTAAAPKQSLFSSKLPMFSGLKSILRSTRKVSASKTSDRPGTPKRPNTATAAAPESSKKVDFTPSVKSRYAVKLAASSPAPARLPSSEERQSVEESARLYDPAAYVIEDDGDGNWEDASSPIEYPTLPLHHTPPGPIANGFSRKAKDHNRRESKEFKSIFTTLHPGPHPSPSNLTTVNMTVDKTNSTAHANKVTKSPSNTSTKPSPSTIRRVRQSEVTDLVEPFEDSSVKTMPHGLPAKKRRRDSIVADDLTALDNDAKENRRISRMPSVPGGWEDSVLDQENQETPEEDEGAKRGGKRARVGSGSLTMQDTRVNVVKRLSADSQPKKKSAAREQAAKSARDRKAGVLSLSRINALSRPKQRG